MFTINKRLFTTVYNFKFYSVRINRFKNSTITSYILSILVSDFENKTTADKNVSIDFGMTVFNQTLAGPNHMPLISNNFFLFLLIFYGGFIT